jgi:hypothetical protein
MATEGALTLRQRRVIVERIERSLKLAMEHWDTESGGEWLKEVELEISALKSIQATDLRMKRLEARVSAKN